MHEALAYYGWRGLIALLYRALSSRSACYLGWQLGLVRGAVVRRVDIIPLAYWLIYPYPYPGSWLNFWAK